VTTLFSKRLPHVLTRKDLAIVLASTYAQSERVDFEEAQDRMERALSAARVADQFYAALSEALQAAKGARTTEDEVIDKLSAGVLKRRSRVKPAPVGPALSAVMVMLNLELGQAPEMMRNALETPKGEELLREGLRALGAHLVGELIK
jgi:hypothetical protein